MFKDKKTLFYGGTLAVLLIIGYFVMFGKGGQPDITTTAEDPTAEVSRDLIATLNNLNTITLDESLFSDPVFMSLADFGVIIPAQPIGRRNPFAPI